MQGGLARGLTGDGGARERGQKKQGTERSRLVAAARREVAWSDGEVRGGRRLLPVEFRRGEANGDGELVQGDGEGGELGGVENYQRGGVLL